MGVPAVVKISLNDAVDIVPPLNPELRRLMGRAFRALHATASGYERIRPEQMRWRMHPATWDLFVTGLQPHETSTRRGDGVHWTLFGVEIEPTVEVGLGVLELVTTW